MSDLLEFLAGWDLSDGMIDTIDTVEVDRHLSVVAEQQLTGVLLAAMRAGEVEVDRPEVVVEARPGRRRETVTLQALEHLPFKYVRSEEDILRVLANGTDDFIQLVDPTNRNA